MTGETLSNRKRAVQIVEACFENPPMRGKKIAGDFMARYIVAMLIADGLLVVEGGTATNLVPLGTGSAGTNPAVNDAMKCGQT